MNDKQNSKDRRTSTRAKAGFRVRFATFDQLVLAYTKNISNGGMFIKTERLLPVNAVVRLVFSLPGDGGDVSCIARVVRTIAPDEERPHRKHGLAVEFLEVSSKSIQRIEEYISQTAAEEAGASMLPNFDYQLKILVVDDDRFYREHAAKSLREQGHEVSTAEDGFKGLAVCLKDPPDLVLSDVQMPRMDGWNFLRTIRARPSLSSTRVIFQTTLGGEQERLKGYQLGVDDYLSKPYTSEELILRIERLFQRTVPKSSDKSRKALRGDLEQVSLPTVLSMLELEQKTGVLMLVGASVCRLYVRDGRPVDIEMDSAPDGTNQMEMVTQIFGWIQGQFEFAPQDVSRHDAVKMSMQGLLMETARLIDEINR
ncbi:MAG: response regulator [Proteobacteria bacterium]|nr:response regulator [Pseudomonadota bacterium]